jgi:hypothetical protein
MLVGHTSRVMLLAVLSLTFALSGCSWSSVKVLERPPGADGFAPVRVESKEQMIAIVDGIQQTAQVGYDVGSSFYATFIEKLNETGLFEKVLYANASNGRTVPKAIRLRLTIHEAGQKYRTETSEAAFIEIITLGLGNGLVTRKDEYESSFTMEATRWDGTVKRFTTKSKGITKYTKGNEDKVRIELMAALRTMNLNALMNQFLREAEFFNVKPIGT